MKITDEHREIAKETYRNIHLVSTGMYPENVNTSQTNHNCSIDMLARALSQRDQVMIEKLRVTQDTSDGYHTFRELYDHRVLLWINLCLITPSKCYLVENHYDGWFLLGMESDNGQISYHCQNKYLNLCKEIERRHPKFDGHTSSDVIKRLEAKAIRQLGKGDE